jgi:hypothetical protein
MFRNLLVPVLAVFMSGAVEAQSTKPNAKRTTQQPSTTFRYDNEFARRLLGWRPIQVGDVGRITGAIKVIQVIDENNLIAEFSYYPAGPHPEEQKKVVWMDIPTKNLTDDEDFTTQQYFEVLGTKKYETAVGSKTVFELKVSEKRDTTEKEKEKSKAETEKTVPDAKASNEQKVKQATRTWTDSTGELKVTATYSGVMFGQVVLVKEDGSKIKIPLEKLSDEDKKWLRDRAKSK